MTEPNTMADIPAEGEITIPEVEADETATDSPAENKETEEAPSAEGEDTDNTQQDDDGTDDGTGDDPNAGGDDPNNVPFHEHPRWKERETEWQSKFNTQEQRHQDDMQKLNQKIEELTKGKTGDLEETDPPAWFGGSKEQWKEFQTWNQQQISAAEKNAVAKINETKTAEQKAVEEATQYFKDELSAIEGDKTINPDGVKVDPNKLLKITMENDLIDSKGRWNYRAGFRIMKNEATSTKKTEKKPAAPDPAADAKKKIASATTSESKGETKPKAFKTTEDFQQAKPW